MNATDFIRLFAGKEMTVVRRYANRAYCDISNSRFQRLGIDPSKIRWFEKIHTGEYHNITDPKTAQNLEALYQNAAKPGITSDSFAF